MKSSASTKQKVESYARQLLETSREEERGPVDLQQMRHALKFSPEVLGLLSRMENENDSKLISQVYRDLKDMLDAQDETVTVDVTTAIRMDAALREKVLEKCKDDLGAPVFLVEHVEPKIIGGIILESRGVRRDMSIRTQLANIRKTLSFTFMGIDAK